jgi:hypothetical protein
MIIMALVKEPVVPSLITNTTMVKGILNGVHKTYEITPCEGYVLHDKDLDSYSDYDYEGNGIGDVILGFYAGMKSVRYDYDFTANPREFYAVLATEVPEGSEIFNIEPEHEVM